MKKLLKITVCTLLALVLVLALLAVLGEVFDQSDDAIQIIPFNP